MIEYEKGKIEENNNLATKIIQKWWRCVQDKNRRKINKPIIEMISKEGNENTSYDQIHKRKKLKHSFSFGMDPNYTNVVSYSNTSNAMFGWVNSKDNPMCK